MARKLASACAAASLAFFFAAVAEADVVAGDKQVAVDEDLGRGRDLVPLPPVPETMAVPTPTESAEAPPPVSLSPAPAPSFAAPRAQKRHRNPVTAKPAKGLEKL
jgi:hypothetical protein